VYLIVLFRVKNILLNFKFMSLAQILQVGYEAGSGQCKLPPLYMQSLDEHLVPVVNAIAVKAQQSSVILELVFRVMEH